MSACWTAESASIPKLRKPAMNNPEPAVNDGLIDDECRAAERECVK
jgi:hypothetical protein